MQYQHEWVFQEFGEVKLRDERLKKRLCQVVERLTDKAGESIHVACEDWASVKAAYRLLDNPEMSAPKISDSHFNSTARRLERIGAADPYVLVAHDTTYLNYGHHPATKGLCEISNYGGENGRNRAKAMGLIMHSSFALTLEGLPLGLLAQKIFTRPLPVGFHKRSGKLHTRVPIETKESYRWLQLLDQSCARVADPERLVHLGDREADIYELFDYARVRQTNFLIRLNHNRHVAGGHKLFERIHSHAPRGKYMMRVTNPDGSEREATIEVRFFPIRVLPPVDMRKRYEPISVYVISAREKNPPSPELQIDWKLLSSLPVVNFQDALEKIGWYQKRWSIEVFHKILKAGCRVESCRLRSADRLMRYLALMSVIAWRIYWVTTLARAVPDTPSQAIFTPVEKEILHSTLTTRTLRPKEDVDTIRGGVRAVARLGGFLGRKCDGDPGPLVLWRGMRRLHDLTLGYQLHLPARCG